MPQSPAESDSGTYVQLKTGIRMHYSVRGSGEPALVLLHGGGGWAEHWQLQVPHLSQHTTVATCDLRGHGRTDAPAGRYSMEVFADDIRALSLELGLHRPVLVGHSLGVPIALRLAFDYPEEVSGLVAVDGGLRTEVQTRHEYRELVEARLHNDRSVLDRYTGYTTSPQSGSADFVKRVLAATPGPSARTINATHYGLMTHMDTAAAAFLCCPVLVIGARDMDYWPMMLAWPQFVPHAEVVAVESTGHYIMLEQPERFNALVLEFLQRIRDGSAPGIDRGGLPSGIGEPCQR